MNVLVGGKSMPFVAILSILLQFSSIVNCFWNIKTLTSGQKRRCELDGAVPFETVHCRRDNATDLVCIDIGNEDDLRSRHTRSYKKQRELQEDFNIIKYHYDEPEDIQYVCNTTDDYKIKGGVATRKLAAVEKELKAPNIESPHCVVNVFLPEDRNETMPGDLVDFVCMTYGGHPLPKVKLYHGDIELPAIDQTFDDTVQFYYRTNVYEDDNGLAFSCVMDTPALESQRSCIAHGLLIPPTATVVPLRFMGLLGDSVTFQCNAEGMPSIVSYTWRTQPQNAMRKMGKRLKISDDGTSVTVRNLKRQDHRVRFYCTVETVHGLTAESRGKIWLDLPTTTMPPTTTVLTTKIQTTTTRPPITSLVDTADIGPPIEITQTPKGGTGRIPKLRTMIPPPLLPQTTTDQPINATEVGSIIPKDDVSITKRIIVIIVLCLLFLFILVCFIIWVTYRKFQYTKPRSKLTLDQIVIVKPRAHQDVHTDREDYAVPDIPNDSEDSGLYSPLRQSNSEAGLFVSEHFDNNNTTVETEAPIYATPMIRRKDPEGSETPNDDDNMETNRGQQGEVTYATCMKQMFNNNLSVKEASSFEELFKNFDENTQRRLFSSQSLSSIPFSEDSDGYLAPSIAGSQSNIPPSNKSIKPKIERSKSFAAPAPEPVYTSLDNFLDKPVTFRTANFTHSPSKTATKVVETFTKDDQPTNDEPKSETQKNKPSKLPRPKTIPPKKPPPKIAKKPVNRNNSSSASEKVQPQRKKSQEQSYLSFTPMFSPEKPSYVPRKPASFIS